MRKIVEGKKDESGAFLPLEQQTTAVSIDAIMIEGLINLKRLMERISIETSPGRVPSREVYGNLKDCFTMLHELKKKERELLEDMSEEELKKLIK